MRFDEEYFCRSLILVDPFDYEHYTEKHGG